MSTLDQVITEFGPALGRITASYERDAALREDLLQEVLIAVHKALPRLQDPARLKPFVFRIAHNRCVDHVVKHASRPDTEEVSIELAEDAASPEQRVVDREGSHRLVQAVRALDLPYRQVITLLLEDLSYAEIAETLGLTLSNVGVRVNRAKSQLKVLLNDER